MFVDGYCLVVFIEVVFDLVVDGGCWVEVVV